ncbi:MAG: Uncharacterized protein AWU57_1018 [Marinobacter sp. T13-3]|nr:MAG: Uncharacterized protein AWU57_1018 [Marinobacter sp. T13-3]
MSLHRITVTYEFCVDAPTEREALEVFEREQSLAISDQRCAIIEGPSASLVRSENDLADDTLNEVPLNAYDYTAQERINRGH